ncbi:MAG: hypothetical protein E7467_00735 [Ruminococcaceae bacterium]|nr:hypothetical protein [Oscillospiraceae bacterium]
MATTEVRQPKQRLLKTQDNEIHNVCAYCRVSTDDTDQKNSLASQERFFASLFKKHPNWSNVGIFADEGLSGTSLEKRNAFTEASFHTQTYSTLLLIGGVFPRPRVIHPVVAV